MKMFFAVFAMVFGLALTAEARSEHCYPDPSYPAFTCHARDIDGKGHGVSSSFNDRSKAAARAIASCQRKSAKPATCRITRCTTPPEVCEGDND